VIQGQLGFENGTNVIGQDYFIISSSSIVELQNVKISNVMLSGEIFKISESDLNISNLTISNIASSGNLVIFRLLNTLMVANTLSYENSTVSFMNSAFSTINWNQVHLSGVTTANEIILIRAMQREGVNSQSVAVNSIIKDSSFMSLKVSGSADAIQIVDSTFATFENTTFSGFDIVPVNIRRSTINSMTELNTYDNLKPIVLIRSTVGTMANSTFAN
jgi:hypothetical protein